MASIQELKRHLGSVSTVAEVTKAMRAIASAKYAKLCDKQKSYERYAQELKNMIEKMPFSSFSSLQCRNPEAPITYVLLGGNRDFCGGYLTELYRYAWEELKKEGKPYHLVVVGKRTRDYCEEHNIAMDDSAVFRDTPSFEESTEFLNQLVEQYLSGESSGITILYQKVKNVMVQIPEKQVLLPLENMGQQERENVSYIPDLETVAGILIRKFIRTEIYAKILEAALGIQAATTVAMRSANENAVNSAEGLKLSISRKRQTMVTQSVIEIAAGAERED